MRARNRLIVAIPLRLSADGSESLEGCG